MPLSVLIIEDQATDAELTTLRLRDDGFDVESLRVVETEAQYLAALDAHPDLILSDWRLPRFSGQRALELLRLRGEDIPFIILSGSIGEEAAIDALHQGASDYVLKDRPARLGEAVRRALKEKLLRQQHVVAQGKLRLADRAFQNTAEGIAVTDTEGVIVSANPAFEAITEYSEAESLGRDMHMLHSERHEPDFYRQRWESLKATGQWRGETWNRRKSGEVYPEWLTISAVRDENGVVTHYVWVFSDISQIKQAQAQIDFLAHHDALTGLPNRSLFQDRLDHALANARRTPRTLAILFIDLDRFKKVNDTLGHPVGDDLLLEVSRRMSDTIRAADTLARVGGDEFVLLLEDDVTARQATTVARKLIDVLAQPLTIAGHTLVITASIGISLYPDDGDDADTLVRHADRAMYEAKQRGRNHFQFFTKALTEGAFERLVMENELRGALGRGELVLHYQPLVDPASAELLSVEALVRWQHPERGLVPPDRFIGLAEEMGIIGEIGAWVLDTACHQLVRWDAEGMNIPRVSVNLSMQQIDRDGLVERVRDTLQRSGLAAQRLELEVTESMLMRNPEHSCGVLNALKALGTQLAVDDFGTGYSSLAYLKRLPLDRLKIDRSFVCDIGTDTNDEVIIRAIIALARSLGLQTVAEGVETAAQAEFIRREGADIAQGYHFGRPQAADALTTTTANARDGHDVSVASAPSS